MDIKEQPKTTDTSKPGQCLDWQQWFDRWEVMQNAYLPQRTARFDLMFRLPNIPADTDINILDLGCGPGSLSFIALQHFPHAHIVAVDTDPILLTIGNKLGAVKPVKVEFIQADIRDGHWWEPYREYFNMVISATALHWLNAEHLAQVYERIFTVLQPGGWFFNADHIASDDPVTQSLYRQLLTSWQTQNFTDGQVENWETYWHALRTAMNRTGLNISTIATDTWEGDDDGLPQSQHYELLNGIGFENTCVHWQYLGEKLIGTQKPAWSKRKLLDAYAQLETSQRRLANNEQKAL